VDIDEKVIEDLNDEAPANVPEEEDAYASVAAAIEETEANSPEAEKEPTKEGKEKPRDESGKFAKKPEKEVKPAEQSEVVAPNVAAQLKVLPTHINKAWTPAEKAAFDKIDPEARALLTAAIERREADIHKEFTRFDEDRVYGKQVKEAVTPYMPMIEAEGTTPSKAINVLLSHAHLLRHGSPQDKFNLWINTAKTYNIPLPKEFGIPQSQSTPATNFDPNAIVAKVPEIVQRELQTYEQKKEEAQIRSTIDAFAADPAHPHYETVRPLMSSLLNSGQATDLQDAYDKACWAVPEIRSTLQQAQESETEAQRIASIRAKTAAAKKAASSVAGAPGKTNGTARPANSNPDPYESVAAAFDQVSAG
jgi:hypothetical protein